MAKKKSTLKNKQIISNKILWYNKFYKRQKHESSIKFIISCSYMEYIDKRQQNYKQIVEKHLKLYEMKQLSKINFAFRNPSWTFCNLQVNNFKQKLLQYQKYLP